MNTPRTAEGRLRLTVCRSSCDANIAPSNALVAVIVVGGVLFPHETRLNARSVVMAVEGIDIRFTEGMLELYLLYII